MTPADETYYHIGLNDGLEGRPRNQFLYDTFDEYRHAYREGQRTRISIQNKLAGADDRVTFESIHGFMKRQCAG